MDEVLKNTQDQIKKNIVASFSKGRGTPVPVGTMNAYKEMKMPDGTWKYVGDQGRNHPAVKHLFEGEAKIVGEVDHLKKEEVKVEPKEIVQPPESKSLGDALKKFSEVRNANTKGVFAIELASNKATVKITGPKEEVEKLKGFGYRVEPDKEEGKYWVDLGMNIVPEKKEETISTNTSEEVKNDEQLLSNYHGQGINLELRGALNRKYEKKPGVRKFQDKHGQFIRVYGIEGDYLVVRQGVSPNFTLIKESDYV